MGRMTDEFGVTHRTLEVPHSFLGTNRKPKIPIDSLPALTGWKLYEGVTLMGRSGNDRYQWKVASVLGNLYRVEAHREERNGHPTSDDGRVKVSALSDPTFHCGTGWVRLNAPPPPDIGRLFLVISAQAWSRSRRCSSSGLLAKERVDLDVLETGRSAEPRRCNLDLGRQ